jgi:hypothetical protein
MAVAGGGFGDAVCDFGDFEDGIDGGLDAAQFAGGIEGGEKIL